MIIPETSKHFSEKRLGTHSTHIPHFLHTHPLKHALLPNNNKYYFIIFIIIEVKVRGKGILGVCKIYVEYVYRRKEINLLIQVPKVRNCQEYSTIRNPVHTGEMRMCGDIVPILITCQERSTSPVRYSLPGWYNRWRLYVRGHPLLLRVCASVTHGVAFLVIPNKRNLNY